MAHRQQFDFVDKVKQQHGSYFKNTSVLEIGSLNLNGTVRDFFENCYFIGLDLAPGPCVDVVCLGHEYQVPDNTFDVVISTECFEHDPHWVKTFTNMIRLCRKNGLIIMSCATTGRPEHGTHAHDPGTSPFTVEKNWNYYKNLTEEDFDQFDLDQLFLEYKFETNTQSQDLYFYGFKR